MHFPSTVPTTLDPTLLGDALFTSRFRDARRLRTLGAQVTESDRLRLARLCCRNYQFATNYQDQDSVELRTGFLRELTCPPRNLYSVAAGTCGRCRQDTTSQVPARPFPRA
ncbi:hypothetical protein MN608_09350 [Microdochium nivale]|nr:hypothetical protein MN608_09350 [Microdochium nivale]